MGPEERNRLRLIAEHRVLRERDEKTTPDEPVFSKKFEREMEKASRKEANAERFRIQREKRKKDVQIIGAVGRSIQRLGRDDMRPIIVALKNKGVDVDLFAEEIEGLLTQNDDMRAKLGAVRALIDVMGLKAPEKSAAESAALPSNILLADSTVETIDVRDIDESLDRQRRETH